MNCSLNTIAGLITAAIAALIAAIGLAYFWITAFPLFAAAALVASVAFYFIPKLKQALLDYATCRGQSDKCRISLTIDTLGQAAATLSAVSFAIAALMQTGALVFLYTWALAWLGASIMVAVLYLVKAGIFSCAITALLLLGVLSDAWAFKKCMDNQPSGGTVGGGVFE